MSELRLARLRARIVKHNACKTPEYNAWCKMKSRCYAPNNTGFRYWGGRGISVCQEWRDSFSAFLGYVGPRPSPKHSLDRYPDPDGNYEPGNVRWATRAEQRANQRDGALAKSVAIKRLHQQRPGFNVTAQNAFFAPRSVPIC